MGNKRVSPVRIVFMKTSDQLRPDEVALVRNTRESGCHCSDKTQEGRCTTLADTVGIAVSATQTSESTSLISLKIEGHDVWESSLRPQALR